MSTHYSDPARESQLYTLSDLEIFYVRSESLHYSDENGDALDEGWYYWPCFPGCLPDSDAIGPFESAESALEHARNGLDD